jgi:release factor glutamine methyltransferase
MSESTPTIAELIRDAKRMLAESGAESPGLDAEILLRDTLGTTREELLIRMPEAASPSEVQAYHERVAQRIEGVPVAYITGSREFYGRDFLVTRDVLVPRPETELLVETAIHWLSDHEELRRTVIDVGTGSGAIAVSIAAETNGAHLAIGSDVSLDALRIAKENGHRLDARVEFVAGSLLDWCGGPVDVIAANLPYLRPDQAHDGIRHEPSLALFAGEDGFALNRELLRQASTLLASPGLLLMEIDPDQAELAQQVAEREFRDADMRVNADLAGLPRCLLIQRRQVD